MKQVGIANCGQFNVFNFAEEFEPYPNVQMGIDLWETSTEWDSLLNPMEEEFINLPAESNTQFVYEPVHPPVYIEEPLHIYDFPEQETSESEITLTTYINVAPSDSWTCNTALVS